MYTTSEFLEQYKKLERWGKVRYGKDGLSYIRSHHHDRRIQEDLEYFKNVRNIVCHVPLGKKHPHIELTDDFKAYFEKVCERLMGSPKHISVPFKQIYKRELSDKVFPTILEMRSKDFSYVPIMDGNKVWGVFSESSVLNIVGDESILLLDDKLQFSQMEEYIRAYSKDGFYDFASMDNTIDDIQRMFYEATKRGRRLDAIYITTTGNDKGDLVAMITIWDLNKL